MKYFFLTILLLSGFCFRGQAQQVGGFFDVEFQEQNIEFFGLDHTHLIALTFDDGPGKGTESILDTLKQYNIKATFFALGSQIKKNPELVQRIVREGHVIGNHSYTHPNLSKEIYKNNPELLMSELKTTHQALKPYLKPGQKLFFRAPYSLWQSSNASVLNQDPELAAYIGPICWDVGRSDEQVNGKYLSAGDWNCWSQKPESLSPSQCAEGYFNTIESINGGVVLMHDIHKKTAEMVKILIPQLLRKGYRFITLNQVQELNRYQYQRGSRIYQPKVQSFSFSRYEGRCDTRPKDNITY